VQSDEASQVIEAMKLQRQNIFSMLALQKKLDALIEFLSKHELKQQLALVK